MNLRLFALFGILWPGMFLTTTEAQDHPANHVAKIVYLQDASNSTVSEQIEKLENLTKDLDSQLQDFSELDGLDTPYQREDLTGVRSSDTSESENAKVLEIKRNLKLLRQVIKEKKAKASLANHAEAAEPLPSRFDTLEPTPASSLEPDSFEMENIRVPQKVLNQIVNAFELGNSLFLAGNFEQAIKYYEIVPTEKLDAFERNWLEFMIASCHQKRMNYELAEAGFRAVAGFKDSPKLSQSATESLKYVASRKRLAELVEAYSARADASLLQAETLIGEANDGE